MSQSPNDEQIAYLRQKGSLSEDRDNDERYKHHVQSGTPNLDKIEDKFNKLIDFGKK